MNPSTPPVRQKEILEGALGEALIDSGLAGLVPRSERYRPLLLLRIGLVLLSALGVLGLPILGIVLSLVLAAFVETIARYRRRGGALSQVLQWPFLWERIRPPFYWTLSLIIALVALFWAREPLLGALGRGILQWLIYRAIHDSVVHPEHYGSWRQFRRWRKSRLRQMAPAFQVWASLASAAIIAGLFFNLSARGLWQSVGQTAWDRLFVFGGGFYLVAVIAFTSISKAGVRRAVRYCVQNWDRVRLYSLDAALRSAHAGAGAALVDATWVSAIESRLEWKNLDNLVSRVGAQLEDSLAGRSRWTGFLLSISTFILVTLMTAVSVFLIVPRETMIDWTFAGEGQQQDILLAVEDLEDLLGDDFQSRLKAAGWADWAQEPLLKLAFFEGAIVASLILLQTAVWHPRATLVSSLHTSTLDNWLTLGTAYLILLEDRFQYLYCGFISRELSGAGRVKRISLPNQVLFVPSVASKARIYGSICDFLHVHALPECDTTSCAIAVFHSHQAARRWARTFFRGEPLEMEKMRSLEPFLPPGRDTDDKCCWLWLGGPLVPLSNLEEARRYARLVTYQDDSNPGERPLYG